MVMFLNSGHSDSITLQLQCCVLLTLVDSAANGGCPPILWKNSVLRAQKVVYE
jgi:hypothetical protein